MAVEEDDQVCGNQFYTIHQTWVQVHWYLYLSTLSTALPSTCKVFNFLLKVTCTCTCIESLSQVLKVLKVLKVLISTFRST